MAILKNGLWGGITGKLGNTVCYILNGKQCVRMNVKSNKPPTQKQLDKRAEMGIVNDFLRPIKALINLGYGAEARKSRRAAYNMVFGYTKKYALKGEGPSRQIDYTKVQVSKGEWPNVWDSEAILTGQSLTVTWSPDCNCPGGGNDLVIVLAYYPPLENSRSTFACFNLCGKKRAQGQDVLQLPDELLGRPIEVYVFVQAADERSVSDTDYLGRFIEAG